MEWIYLIPVGIVVVFGIYCVWGVLLTRYNQKRIASLDGFIWVTTRRGIVKYDFPLNSEKETSVQELNQLVGMGVIQTLTHIRGAKGTPYEAAVCRKISSSAPDSRYRSRIVMPSDTLIGNFTGEDYWGGTRLDPDAAMINYEEDMKQQSGSTDDSSVIVEQEVYEPGQPRKTLLLPDGLPYPPSKEK